MRKIENLIIRSLSYISRKILTVLPSFLSSSLGELGLTNFIKRSPRVNFRARVYDSCYFINVRSDYLVERHAVRRKISPTDPFFGIKSLGLKRFTAIDIGANVGTIALGLVGIGAVRVYAIEPGLLYKRLVDNVQLNSLSNIISTHNIGLGSLNDRLFWAEDKNNLGNAHLVRSYDSLDFSKINTKFIQEEFHEVQVETLDYFSDSNFISNIDLVKLDVEGMEWEVVKGGRNTIEKYLPVVVAETHRVASDMMKYDCLTPMFSYFYGLGYATYSLNENGVLTKFIYPNFGVDTFFIHQESPLADKVTQRR